MSASGVQIDRNGSDEVVVGGLRKDEPGVGFSTLKVGTFIGLKLDVEFVGDIPPPPKPMELPKLLFPSPYSTRLGVVFKEKFAPFPFPPHPEEDSPLRKILVRATFRRFGRRIGDNPHTNGSPKSDPS